jgi:phospholipid/cholesterol/gamma-HCH transport system substrate-binding protein
MKMHYSHRLSSGRVAQIVGTFVMVPLLGLVVVGIFMAKAEHLFEDKYLLHASLTKSHGLEPGAPVLMSGVPIGRVKAVEFTDQGAIDVTLQLLSRYREMVRGDSRANFEKSGIVMGQTQVEITMGHRSDSGQYQSEVLPEGATIAAKEPEDLLASLKDLRGEFDRQVKPVLESVQRTVNRIEEITKDVQPTVQTAGRVMADVERSTSQLPEIMASVKRTTGTVERTAATLPEITGSVKKTLASVDGIVTDVRKATGKLPAVVDAAQEAVNNIKATTESIKTASKDLGPIVRTAHSTLDDVNLIVRGAKKTWPVNTMIKNAEPEPSAGFENGLQSLRGDQVTP